MTTKFLKINPDDNVAVAISNLSKGEQLNVEGTEVTLLEDVPAGHKFTLKDIKEGENVIKYGFPIGHAKEELKQGRWAYDKNIKTNLAGTLEYEYKPISVTLTDKDEKLTFNGYRRKNGEVGISNEIWIVPTVGCVNGIADNIITEFKKTLGDAPLKVDAIEAYKHNYGCSQLGDDHEATKKILRDITLHPNAGGEVAEGVKILTELYNQAAQDKRTEIPLSELKVGLKCGGSDGFSGITANPLLGVFSDWLVSQGGTTVLTEVPEMFGAETILMSRCENKDLFDKTVHLINDFKEYFLSHGEPVGENPSPGNKAGGISTLEDKALGCTQKCGKSYVKDVLMYGDRIKTKGLNLLSAPGNDLVAATALGAAGCQMVLFTTGRGTPFGSFVPTMKVSTNTPLYENKKNWIDFNAGQLVQGKTMEEVKQQFIKYVISVANGEFVNHEKHNSKAMAIFKRGVTL